MLDNPAYEVVTICETDADTRKRQSGSKLFANLRWVSVEEMLADKSLDLIVFEGEVKDAVPMGKRILQAGKHLHLEKPPTNKMEPFRELANLARERRKLLQLGYLWRFHDGVIKIQEAVKNGWLGDVYMIRATINSDRGQSQRDTEARYPGGALFELGGHMIDVVVALLGRPGNVRHWLRHDTSIKDTLKDNTLAVFEYPRALALVISSAKDPANGIHRTFEIIGSGGTMLIAPMEPNPILHVHLAQAVGPYKKGAQQIALPPQPRFIRDFQELARAIQTNSALRFSYNHELLLHETLLRASGEI